MAKKLSLYEKAYHASCEVTHQTPAQPKRTRTRRRFGGPYIFPGKSAGQRPRFPIPDAYHAKLALSALERIAGRHGTGQPYKTEARKVLSAVKKRFPHVYACEGPLVAAIRARYSL